MRILVISEPEPMFATCSVADKAAKASEVLKEPPLPLYSRWYNGFHHC